MASPFVILCRRKFQMVLRVSHMVGLLLRRQVATCLQDDQTIKAAINRFLDRSKQLLDSIRQR
jgi:hypothetical protein